MTEQTKVGLERHAVTVLTMVIVALILWVGSEVQRTQVKLAAIQVELKYIKENTNVDNSKFKEIEERLDAIERAIHGHERRQ
jgi:hypothetical protein